MHQKKVTNGIDSMELIHGIIGNHLKVNVPIVTKFFRLRFFIKNSAQTSVRAQIEEKEG